MKKICAGCRVSGYAVCGKHTSEKLKSGNFRTIGDLALCNEKAQAPVLRKNGGRLKRCAMGEDTITRCYPLRRGQAKTHRPFGYAFKGFHNKEEVWSTFLSLCTVGLGFAAPLFALFRRRSGAYTYFRTLRLRSSAAPIRLRPTAPI